MKLMAPQVALVEATSTTAAPTPSYYNCDFVGKLPYGGAEILGLAAVFMLLVVNFAVAFLSVTAKQLWPSMLDPVVANRLIATQKMFPGLGANSDGSSTTTTEQEETENSEESSSPSIPVKKHTLKHPVTGAPIEYNRVVAAEAYIAGKSVDEDLFTMLLNNKAYGTVSSYCSSTVRGYTMLSTMLMCAGMILSFLCIHNILVDPTQGGTLGTISLIGYCMCFLTAMVMCGPSHAVFRNANIWLTTNIPQTGSPDKMERLHGIGIVSFCLLPMVSHLLYALFNKDKMPNYTETMSGVIIEIIAAASFGISGALNKLLPGKVSGTMSNKIGIACEVFAVFSSFLGFVNYEYYATAACAGHLDTWHTILIVAMFAPWALVARHFCWAPTSFTTPPSLLFMNDNTPVATYGPCPALSFNGSTFNADGVSSSSSTTQELPHITFDPEMLKM